MGDSMSYLNLQRSIGQKVERARIRKLMQMSCTKTTKEETIGSDNWMWEKRVQKRPRNYENWSGYASRGKE